MILTDLTPTEQADQEAVEAVYDWIEERASCEFYQMCHVFQPTCQSYDEQFTSRDPADSATGIEVVDCYCELIVKYEGIERRFDIYMEREDAEGEEDTLIAKNCPQDLRDLMRLSSLVEFSKKAGDDKILNALLNDAYNLGRRSNKQMVESPVMSYHSNKLMKMIVADEIELSAFEEK